MSEEGKPKREWKARFAVQPFTEDVDDVTLKALEHLCPEKRVALAMSAGKDSIAAWLVLKEQGYEVVPVFREIIPGLRFMDETIAGLEAFFGTEVMKVASRDQFLDLFHWYGKTQSLETVEARAELLNRPPLKKGIDDQILAMTGCNILVVGTKASDSLNRRTNFMMTGPFNPNRRTFALTWRLAKNAPLDMMIKRGCPIPKFYLWLARSPEFMFDSEMYFISKFFPDDFAKILEYLPEADVRVKNFEFSDKPRLLMPDKRIIKAKEEGHPFV